MMEFIGGRRRDGSWHLGVVGPFPGDKGHVPEDEGHVPEDVGHIPKAHSSATVRIRDVARLEPRPAVTSSFRMVASRRHVPPDVTIRKEGRDEGVAL